MVTRRLALVAVAGLLLSIALGPAACSSSTAPSTINLSGQWSGPDQDNIGGAGTLVATIVQDGSTFNGTWTLTFPNSAFDNGGALTGTVNGSQVSGSLTTGGCPLSITFVTNSAVTSMTGNYASVNCSATSVGTFTLNKQ